MTEIDYDHATDASGSNAALSSGQDAFDELYRRLERSDDSKLRSVGGDARPDTFKDAVEAVESICIDLGVQAP